MFWQLKMLANKGEGDREAEEVSRISPP